ncbi:sugar phosphate isomerase [Phytohabitans flavus]|uniref:Sugar phosphate isomerase n=1 Tax=Phytohabitans flavus TaxID=1076124 RepID=A0A6F8XYE5_9ACTN|nr:TIM barrel protein [Phytohabitans flavus]BCB78819.1 sugar phosphate isomerase [Phytohabitans flavus]
MTIRPGLVSVTFRHLAPSDVVRVAREADLAAIEWGGDIHVPHGDTEAAARAAALTADAGLTVSAYGSYYRLAHPDLLDASTVVRTAVWLGAPTIRVWAGRVGSAEAPADYRRAVVDDALRVADLAEAAGVTVSLECHRNTLTDTRESTLELFGALRDAPIRATWQPHQERDAKANEGDLRAVLPMLANLHVFAWTPDRTRLPCTNTARSGPAIWRQHPAHQATATPLWSSSPTTTRTAYAPTPLP